MKKQLFLLLLMIYVSCIYSQENEAEAEFVSAEEVSEIDNETIEADDSPLLEVSDLDSEQPSFLQKRDIVFEFFNRPGLALIPRSRTFSIRNILSLGMLFESDDDRDGNNDNELVPFFSLRTEIAKNFGYLQFKLANVIRYDNNFDIFPNASVSYQYKARKFNFSARQTFVRSNQFESLDEGLDDVTHLATTSFSFDTNYKRFTYGTNFRYSYRKSFDFDDEDHIFRSSFFVQYNLFSGWSVGFNYTLEYIDDKIEDTVSHNTFVFLVFPIERSVNGKLSIGTQLRNDNLLLIGNASVSWKILPNLVTSLNASANTLPAFNDAFQYTIQAGGSASYVFSDTLGFDTSITFLYSEFDNGNVDYGAIIFANTNYRLTSNIDLDFRYRLEYRDSQQNNDFANHRIIFGINIIF
ncbi:hypothetical protein [Candidatus Uabimicrobium sp. HlEnr_7]|uniref:hypothetical protein n=1 Tax=Candidatus Uabimicrobium helgolandensis TaxID=3095367 RepID=UPI0035561A0A